MDQLISSQQGKEKTANENFDSLVPAALFGRHATATGNLTWGYYGGPMQVDTVLTIIADGTVVLTASNVNYIEHSRAGVVSANTTGFTAANVADYTANVGANTVTSYIDYRGPALQVTQEVSISITGANVTLTAAQARADYITTTGILTGNHTAVLPLHGKWDVFCNNTGAFTTTFIGASGTGVVVGQGKRARIRGDGTNIVRMTADV